MAHSAQSELSSRQGGFALMQGLVILGVLAAVIAIAATLFQKGIRQEAANLARSEMESTFSEISTILRRPETCVAALGLTGAPFPTSGAHPTATGLSIYYPQPDPGLPPSGKLIGSGDLSPSGRFKVVDIAVSDSPGTVIGNRISPSATAFLMTFRFQAQIPILGSQVFTRELPMYVLLDTSRRMYSCVLTKFTRQDPSGTNYTLEDQVCQAEAGATPSPTPSSSPSPSTAHYDPANQVCRP